MSTPQRTWDFRTAVLIAGAALLGAAWALFNFEVRAGGTGFGAIRPLVWTVFATPFAAFWGWLIARRHEGWLAAFVCFCIYFFAIFLGARLELLVLGDVAAAANGHALYFRLTLLIQCIACLVAAAQRASRRGTMEVSTVS